jgi:hypothetical protein
MRVRSDSRVNFGRVGGPWRRPRIVPFVLATMGCTSASPSAASLPPDASTDAPAIKDAGTSPSDGLAATCGVSPYPQGMACDDPTQVCVPEAGFDCCLCLSAMFCAHPIEWVCESSDPGCPPKPPTVGTPCSLRQYAGCVYCYQSAVVVDCADGTWQSVANQVYCQATD